MKRFFSVAELVGLPGMPTTNRGVNLAVHRSGWRTRDNGSGREIHIDSLPAATRSYLMAQAGVALHAPTTAARQIEKEQGLRKFSALPNTDPRKCRARAREWILCRWAEFAREHNVSAAACATEFANAYRHGNVAVPTEHAEILPSRNGVRSLDRATLYRWRKAFDARGIAGLIDSYGGRKGRFKVAVSGELQTVILGCIHSAPHITPGKIHQFLQADYPQHAAVITAKSIARFIDSWKADNQQAWVAATNPDKWKNQYQAAFGSHFENVSEPNQLWEMDSTPGDWQLVDGRHCVVTVLDMFTRRTIQYVSKTSKAEAVCLAFRKAVLAWGVPKAVRTDNGADYKSVRFCTVLADLEIEQEFCEPFASEQKGSVERVQKTMSHGILDLLPGFSGHNVAEAQVIRARKSFAQRLMTPGDVVDVALTAQDLQQRLDQWAEFVYGRDVHSGLNGQSPWSLATAWQLPVRKISDERALDALLSEIAGNRTVTKKGLRLDHRHYIAPELVVCIGDEVQVRRDVADIGRVYVYDLQGQFVCTATAPEVLGISRAEVAAMSSAVQRKHQSQQRAEAKQWRRHINRNIGEAILEHRMRESENVAQFPPRSTEYSTAALREHGVAARSNDAPVAAPDDEHKRQALAALAARMAAPKAAVVSADDPQRRYRHWLRLDQRVRNAGWLSAEERALWESYPNGFEFRAMKQFFTNFNLGLNEAEG